jgi:hypothetical protein
MGDSERRHFLDRRVVPSIIASHLLRRISWHAVVGGTFIALAAQITLTVLGQALGIRWPGLWQVITSVISFMASGWAAAKIAGIPYRPDCALHGLLTWATAISVQLMLFQTPFFGMKWTGRSPDQAAWTFFALLIAAAAASVSGWQSAPSDIAFHPLKAGRDAGRGV